MKITLRGDKAIIRSFTASPKILAEHLATALETGAKLIKQRARRAAGSPPIVNTGELAQGIDYKPTGKLSIRVGSDAKYAPFVEFGRGPGRMPPVAPIERWAATKIGKKGLGFAIARKIGRTGTKPQPYFFPAVEQSLSDLQAIFHREMANFVKAL